MSTFTIDTYQEYTSRVAWLVSKTTEGAGRPSSQAGETLPGRTAVTDVERLFVQDPSKNARFPERLLKILDTQLKAIAMGTNPRYNNQRIRRTTAVFWSNWSDRAFMRQMRDTRRVEDLILSFVAASSKTLRKDVDIGDQWKEELNVQTGQFIEIVSDAIKACGPNHNEVLQRLQSYRTGLLGPSDYSNGTLVDRQGSRSGIVPTILDWVLDDLFEVPSFERQGVVQHLSSTCSLKLALRDIKLCLQSLNTDNPFPLSRNDFPSEPAWQKWRIAEVTTLSQLMLAMLQRDPGLVNKDGSSDEGNDQRSQQVAGERSRDDAFHTKDLEAALPASFTFIPPNHREQFTTLLRRCLHRDLQLLATLPEDEEVSLGILSARHLELLKECAVQWRLPSSLRLVETLHMMLERWADGTIPFECLLEAFEQCRKLLSESCVEDWTISDQQSLLSTLRNIQQHIAGILESELRNIAAFKKASVRPYLSLYADIETLAVPGIQEDLHLKQRIVSCLREQAFLLYTNEVSKNFAPGLSYEEMVAIADAVETQLHYFGRRFSGQLIGVAAATELREQVIELFFHDLQGALPTLIQILGDSVFPVDLALDLYLKLHRILSEHPRIEIRPVVENWLNETASKTAVWADNSINADKFEPVHHNSHSPSVADLFDGFHGAIDILEGLKWPDDEQRAQFGCRLAMFEIILKSLTLYCSRLETAFHSETSPQVEKVSSSSNSWLDKARTTISGVQGSDPFNVTPKSCVMLNNIEALKEQLDRVYDRLNIDGIAQELPVSEDRREDQSQTGAHLFSIKVVSAQGLSRPSGDRLSPYVVLSDQHGNRIAKTRTLQEAESLRWGETFDIAVQGEFWLMATVRHRHITGKNQVLGRTYLRVDTGDLSSRDLVLRLDTGGYLQIKIDIERESSDIRFKFGRAFRKLKRVEDDMVRVYVDKMLPTIRYSLGRPNLKSIQRGASLDYGDTLGKLTAAYRSAVGDKLANKIPPLSHEGNDTTLSDTDIEATIHPLFDYLDSNNHTLSSYLAPSVLQVVMARIWKEILGIIEDLIIPPLSDNPSDMRPLKDSELDAVLKWLKFLRDFFYADGKGVPLDVLQTRKYDEILRIRIYYDWSTDQLMEECVRDFQATLRSGGSRRVKPAKSVLSQRNLGTIKAHARAKKMTSKDTGSGETIIKILRMRPGTAEFLTQQLQVLSTIRNLG